MSISRNLRMRLQRDGWKRTLYHGRHWVSEKFHERRYGISTQNRVELAPLGFCEDYQKYDPAPYRDLKKIFAKLPLDRHHDEVLIDYGSGAGRVALMAGMLFPFKSIIGVEVVPSLIELAERNLDNVRRRLVCGEIRFLERDAIDFELPAAATVIFFFNPFTGKVLERVLDNIQKTLDASKRSPTIVFLNPKHAEAHLRQRPWLQQTAVFPAYANSFHIYRTDPSQA